MDFVLARSGDTTAIVPVRSIGRASAAALRTSVMEIVNAKAAVIGAISLGTPVTCV